MRKIVLILIAFLAILGPLLSACNSNESQTSLAGTTWQLVSYGAANQQTPAVTGVETSLIFGKDGQVSGSLGCNSFSGGYSLKDGKITFGSLATTLMACPDAQMTQESAVFKMLSGTVSYKLNGSSLTLTVGDNMALVLTSK